MKICIVSRKVDLSGGIARYAFELCRYMVASGHRVTLYVSDYRAPRIDGLEVRRVPMVNGSLFERMKMHAVAKLLQVCTFSIASILMVPRGRFDIVHVQGDSLVMPDVRTAHSCHLFWIGMARREAGTLAGKLAKSLLNPLHMLVSFIELKDYRNSARVIAVSESTAEEVASTYSIERSKIRAVPNGVDIDLFDPDNRSRWREETRRRYGIPEGEILVLFAGAQFGRKGLGALLEATGKVERAREEGRLPAPPVRLMVIGGDRSGPWKKLARELGIGQRVVFTGHVTHIERYFAAGDIFALPSAYEPFGLVLTEAMASGLPVVTSDRVGAASLIEHGRSGFVVSHGDLAGGLEKVISRLAADPGEAGRVGAAGRAVAERCTWDDIGRMTLEVYAEAARSANGGPEDRKSP